MSLKLFQYIQYSIPALVKKSWVMQLTFYVKYFYLRTAREHESEQHFHSPERLGPPLCALLGKYLKCGWEILRIKLIIN